MSSENKSEYTGFVDPVSHVTNSDFDITLSYVNELERRSLSGSGNKRLLLKKHRYICNGDHVQYNEEMTSENDDVLMDVETISENISPAFKESLPSNITKLQPASVSLIHIIEDSK